jgi:hypothetical protein
VADRLYRTKRFVEESTFWRPSGARLLSATRPMRSHQSPYNPGANLRAAAAWLGRAQDATGNGGVAWAYRLRSGWGGAYPETTGYIVPTFLNLATALGEPAYRDRASKAIEFLLPLQMDGGPFPAGTLERTDRSPSIFNTGQIICGLTAWYRATGDEEILRAAIGAGRWLGTVQDDDGAWRKYAHLAYPVTYTAHAACWVAELGVLAGDEGLKATAERQLDWVLGQRDPATGWFERSGFAAEDHAAHRAVTHTIAYTIWGVLMMGELLQRTDAVAAARSSALGIADLVAAKGWLPGMLGAGWEPKARYACLTGNAQMALVWLRLNQLEPDPRLTAAAARLIDRVGSAQQLRSSDDGILGGIPGSDPVWGDYIQFGVPNWAAKFYIDALLAQDDPRLALVGRAAGVAGGAAPG